MTRHTDLTRRKILYPQHVYRTIVLAAAERRYLKITILQDKHIDLWYQHVT